ncbi:helix-turn-helix domain-containing protein [Pseudonocardia spinosispora]|uniref:AraC-like ligand-binding domain-containing protein n=1 Tax=Pseudonocardia spinosispora TaxID=103441 RepID=UPI0009FC0670|nr:helix-turn-helix domain-containing protein [Pseudonocardia spinosispora]
MSGVSVRRTDAWRHAMSEAFVPLEVGALDRERFTGRLRTDQLGELMVAELSSSAQRVSRTPRLITESDRQLWQIAVSRRGTARVEQDSRQAELGPGDLVIYETARPFHWTFPEPWAATVFTLPREAVPLTAAQSRHVTARRLAGGSGTTGVLSRFLLDLAEHGASMPPSRSRRLVADLAGLVVSLAGFDGGPERAGPKQTLLAEVKDHIAANLGDPMLCPGSIAAARHISLRSLHVLFADEPLSVSRYIRAQRLRRSAADLLDPRFADLSIASIAARAGFGDLSGFSRAFRATYGRTPSSYRRTG